MPFVLVLALVLRNQRKIEDEHEHKHDVPAAGYLGRQRGKGLPGWGEERMVSWGMRIRSLWELFRAAVEAWINDNVPRLGAALSFYTVFAISPLFVIIVFIASLWIDKSSVQSALLNEVSTLIGRQGAEAIAATLRAAAPHSQGVLASAIAIGTLLLSATGLFIELQGDLNAIWGVEQKPGLGVWGFLKGRLLSFAMVVGIGFLLLVSLIVSTALQAVVKYFDALIPGKSFVWVLLNDGVSLLVVMLLFAMIFKVLRDVKIAWRDVWIGAGVTAFLFTGGKFLIGLYLGQSATVSAYGAAGSLALILLWVYYSAQILFFGAELTQAYANRFGARLEPKPNARWIVPPPVSPPQTGQTPRRLGPKRQAELIAQLRDKVESMKTIRRGLEYRRRAS